MTEQNFTRRVSVPEGHALTIAPKTVRYVGDQYLAAPFDPTSAIPQVYRADGRPPFMWEAGA